MTFSEDCVQLFGTVDLFIILNLDKDGGNLTAAKIKKAYYQQSVLWHPDRFSAPNFSEEERVVATKKFQIVSRAYNILNDSEKRAIYLETGKFDDDVEGSTRDWPAVWRGMFKKVTKEDIEEYLKKFRGSPQEMEDVKNAYTKYKGNMDKILSTVIGADVQSEDRIREIIRYFIERGQVEAYPKFVNEPPSARVKRIKKATREAKEAEKALKEMRENEENCCISGNGGEMEVDGGGDLAAMILAKHKKREQQQVDFLAHLEQKYSSAKPAKKKARKE